MYTPKEYFIFIKHLLSKGIFKQDVHVDIGLIGAYHNRRFKKHNVLVPTDECPQTETSWSIVTVLYEAGQLYLIDDSTSSFDFF